MNTDKWDKVDQEFQTEFDSVSEIWKKDAVPSSGPSLAVDRMVREQAKLNLGEQVEDSWLFGNLPRLWLVMCVFFGLAIYGLLTYEWNRTAEGTDRVILREGVVNEFSHQHGWVKFSVEVDLSGKTREIRLEATCFASMPHQECMIRKSPDEPLRTLPDQEIIRRARILLGEMVFPTKGDNLEVIVPIYGKSSDPAN